MFHFRRRLVNISSFGAMPAERVEGYRKRVNELEIEGDAYTPSAAPPITAASRRFIGDRAPSAGLRDAGGRLVNRRRVPPRGGSRAPEGLPA